MTKVCVCCGKKNNPFFGADPIYLEENRILCHKCAEPIKRDFDNLYYVETKEEFNDLKDKILDYCNKNFDEFVTYNMRNLINDRYIMVFGEESNNSENEEQEKEAKPKPAYDEAKWFDNVGNKLKSAAKFTFCAFVIVSVISFIINLITLSEFDAEITEYIVSIIYLIIEIMSEFVLCLCLYGFGIIVNDFEERKKNN